MHFAKSKREKVSICNICREEKSLSWDHVPPKGGIKLSTVKMDTVFSLMTSGEEKPRLRESQNGMRYRTICSSCNSFLGSEYDSTMNDFAMSVGKYLESSLTLPNVINHSVKPQRLMKAIVGHLVTAKVAIENTLFDRLAREYVLNKDAPLPDEINIFYWVYPYDCSITMRDFGMFTPRGTFQKPAVFQMIKYFPIAYICCENQDYEGLDCLSHYRHASIDDELEIPITLDRVEKPYWPEEVEGNNILFAGASAAGGVVAIPK